jgi:hypothetical protein
MSHLKEEIMIKRTSLVFNSNIEKSKIYTSGVHPSRSPGVEAACLFLGEFLAHINSQNFSKVPHMLMTHGGHKRFFNRIFKVAEYDGKLLEDAVIRCFRISAEISLVSSCNIAIKMLFYEKRKKEWYVSFQINFSIDEGLYSGSSANVNNTCETGFK